ncbi:MAG TPA: chemotaxis protein CheA [Candidatus Acidoferrales bacterium]|nr:chemotaxis protein CheA [Candidatus Acidoferrales bacterium]
MSFDNDQYRTLFIEEAKEHIDTITKSMLILEKEPENKEVVNMLFRSAHTLKGSSGMMGFKDFQELTHAMEDVFDEMRKGNKPSSDLISLLLDCVDALTLRLDNISNHIEGDIDYEAYKTKLHSMKAGLSGDCSEPKIEHQEPKTAEPSPAEAETAAPAAVESSIIQTTQEICNASEGERCFTINLKFTSDCGFKSIRAGMILDKIAEVAKVIKTVPDKTDLDEAKLNHGFKLVITSKLDEKELENCAKQILEIEEAAITAFNDSTSALNSIMPAAALISEPSNNYVVTVENKSVTKVAPVETQTQTAQTVRVKFDQLDKLMNLVGELVINKIALLQVTADNHTQDGLKRITENIDRLTADLQDLVMQVRMVPVSQVFDRFPRLVRDLSIKEKKKISLVMEGREIEVDRSVLDEIGEPLIHLLRNSVDHGIELPEERQSNSKNETGQIVLSAQRNGNQVIIEIYDDGAGINPEKIKISAAKKGVATQTELDKMTKEQLINLIFLPGFSTAKEITETSGRGVGMDVVKTKITALGGIVHVDSQVGKGTRTTIKLPITLAIIQAILVTDTNETFAIPTSQVSEIVRVKKTDVQKLGKTHAIVVRDHVIPMMHLHKMLHLPESDEEELELLIIYLGDEHTKMALAVDSVLRQQDILVKSLNDALSGIKGVSGATILGDGQVVLVLDVAQFVRHNRNAA